MIGMTSALIAWLLPFWSKGTYHQNHLTVPYRDGKIKSFSVHSFMHSGVTKNRSFQRTTWEDKGFLRLF